MSSKEIARELYNILADSYALYLKTQNFHWNVKGPYFQTLHVLFEEQYTELAAAIDEIAERIKQAGAYAPGGFGIFSELATIKDAEEEQSAEQMLATLKGDHSTLVSSLERVRDLADERSDQVTVDLMNARLAFHEKELWRISSHLE